MTAWSNSDSQFYPGPAPAWHLDRFRETMDMDVVIDDRLRDAHFAIDTANNVSFISAWLGSNKRLHRVITEVALTVQFGADAISMGTRELQRMPSLPRLVAAYGNLVLPKQR